MYILLKTDNTVNINILNKKEKAHYFYAKDLNEAKMYLDELEDTDNEKYWSKYYAKPDLKCCEEFNKYLRETILSPNKLSEKEIKELCSEAIYWLEEKPEEKLNIEIGISKYVSSPIKYQYEHIWRQLVDIIDQYTQTKNNIEYSENDFNPVSDLGIHFPFVDSNFVSCGALNTKFYKLIYYFDFLGIPIHDAKLKYFWQFYKKTMDVYAIGIKSDSRHNVIRVIPKPDEIFIKDEITHCKYFGNYYCNRIKSPKWLYDAEKDDLKISDFSKMTNVDLRTVFIAKAGLEKFIKKGKIIDSWENYPENEWWAKSEYKLIDMSKILVKEVVRNYDGKSRKIRYYDYAPYLYMKNQTTGAYHMEGVSPDCRDLYDALKMRYDLLDLSEYKIEDIK